MDAGNNFVDVKGLETQDGLKKKKEKREQFFSKGERSRKTDGQAKEVKSKTHLEVTSRREEKLYIRGCLRWIDKRERA